MVRVLTVPDELPCARGSGPRTLLVDGDEWP